MAAGPCAALTGTGRRGLTPLFWAHTAPHGDVELNMSGSMALRMPALAVLLHFILDRGATATPTAR